jgi:hypothetical protein
MHILKHTLPHTCTLILLKSTLLFPYRQDFVYSLMHISYLISFLVFCKFVSHLINKAMNDPLGNPYVYMGRIF